MIKYYFENVKAAQDYFRTIAIIDDQYFWSMDWRWDTTGNNAAVSDFQAGFLSAAIREKCKSLEEVSPAEIRERFGSFAYYVERAVSGLKSYLLWISPDSTVNEASWKISMN